MVSGWEHLSGPLVTLLTVKGQGQRWGLHIPMLGNKQAASGCTGSPGREVMFLMEFTTKKEKGSWKFRRGKCATINHVLVQFASTVWCCWTQLLAQWGNVDGGVYCVCVCACACSDYQTVILNLRWALSVIRGSEGKRFSFLHFASFCTFSVRWVVMLCVCTMYVYKITNILRSGAQTHFTYLYEGGVWKLPWSYIQRRYVFHFISRVFHHTQMHAPTRTYTLGRSGGAFALQLIRKPETLMSGVFNLMSPDCCSWVNIQGGGVLCLGCQQDFGGPGGCVWEIVADHMTASAPRDPQLKGDRTAFG